MKANTIIIPAVALGLLSGVGLLGLDQVRADDNNNYPSLVQKLAERFGLDSAEVQQVIAEVRTKRQQQMQTLFEERLNQAVSEGKITPEQKAAIFSKRTEMEANRGKPEDLLPQERRERRQTSKNPEARDGNVGK